jgi:hypothetical protein
VFENIKAPYIYEFDLSNFFEQVDLGSILERMKELRYPKETVEFMRLINQSIVKLRDKEGNLMDSLPEPESLLRIQSDGQINVNHLNYAGKDWKELHPEIAQQLVPNEICYYCKSGKIDEERKCKECGADTDMISLMREDMEDLDGVTTE